MIATTTARHLGKTAVAAGVVLGVPLVTLLVVRHLLVSYHDPWLARENFFLGESGRASGQ